MDRTEHGEAKSTVDEIRERFDNDVERFSNLDTGQVAVADAPRHLQLIAHAAAATNPQPGRMLDVGCGAGNFTIRLLHAYRDTAADDAALPGVDCDLLDLSRAMLDRAEQRVGAQTAGQVRTIQSDIRNAALPTAGYDVVIAAQCLHHLREDAQWHAVFEKLFDSLQPGGSLWIADSICHQSPAIEQMMWQDWGDYLTRVKDAAYRDHVFSYVRKEDTPRPLTWQLELMRQVGFENLDILHVNMRFASFGGIKPR